MGTGFIEQHTEMILLGELILFGVVAVAFAIGKYFDKTKSGGVNQLAGTAIVLQSLQKQIDDQRGRIEQLEDEVRVQRRKTHIWAGFANEKMLTNAILMQEVNARDLELGHQPTYDVTKELEKERDTLKRVILETEITK